MLHDKRIFRQTSGNPSAAPPLPAAGSASFRATGPTQRSRRLSRPARHHTICPTGTQSTDKSQQPSFPHDRPNHPRAHVKCPSRPTVRQTAPTPAPSQRTSHTHRHPPAIRSGPAGRPDTRSRPTHSARATLPTPRTTLPADRRTATRPSEASFIRETPDKNKTARRSLFGPLLVDAAAMPTRPARQAARRESRPAEWRASDRRYAPGAPWHPSKSPGCSRQRGPCPWPA